ncbi:MAG: hypothetical protein HeimC3_46350 [Candidatus Heimdallarchaeota archaeon LC_3]|nr:MAG: hypothetical protein HeimC3_46350 [Candidatus Heimdallarchaeota archaeon LC_3]
MTNYLILNSTENIPGTQEFSALVNALMTWRRAIAIDFVETHDDPVFTFSWESDRHGDNSPFDGPGNTLAHAFPPSLWWSICWGLSFR